MMATLVTTWWILTIVVPSRQKNSKKFCIQSLGNGELDHHVQIQGEGWGDPNPKFLRLQNFSALFSIFL